MKKTRSAIKALTELAPTTARRIVGSGQDGDFETEEIDAEQVEEGDLLLVRAAAALPAYGPEEAQTVRAASGGGPLPGAEGGPLRHPVSGAAAGDGGLCRPRRRLSGLCKDLWAAGPAG